MLTLIDRIIDLIGQLTAEGFSEGFISARADNGMYINDSSNFDGITEENIICVDARENVNLEKAVHLTAYENLSEIETIIHLYPPFLTALASIGIPLCAISLPDADGFGNKIPLCLNNTYQVSEYIGRYGVALTRDNGVYIGFSYGSHVQRAVMIENAARNYLTALALGEPAILSARTARKQFARYISAAQESNDAGNKE